MAKKILVTGGAGYIGSQTVYNLFEAGFEVVVLDNLVTGHKELVSEKAEFEVVDLCDINKIRRVFENAKISAVIHFAAAPGVVNEAGDVLPEYYENNLLGTLNLLQVMREFGVKNIVFSSTAAVYGVPDEVPITEKHKKEPINTYGFVKSTTEKILQDYHKSDALNYVCLRYFNACGADNQGRTGEMHDPETHLIPLVLQTALGKREKIFVYGCDYNTEDGTCIRDYVHVEDLANAHTLALQKLFEGGLKNEVINLGCSEGYSVNQIIEKVKEVTKKDFKVEYSERRVGDPAILIASNRKANQLLDWSPTNDLTSIIETAWKWHQKIN